MTDPEFEKYIASVIKEYGADYEDEAALDNTPHNFSPEFERKMDILTGKRHKNIRLTPKRLLILITAALLAAFILTVSVSAAISPFMTIKFKEFTYVKPFNCEDAPNIILEKYIPDIPDGFLLTDKHESELFIRYEYRDKNGGCISFSQSTKDPIYVANGDIDRISIGGCDGLIFDWDSGGSKIIWDNGDYIFDITITSGIGKDKQIEMANSVHKTE